MARQQPALMSFNRGEVSKEALGRVDIDRLRLSAAIQENWLPYVLGPMMLRPGLGMAINVRSDLANRVLPFVFSNNDVALLEFTDEVMRPINLVNDVETLVTRAAVSTAFLDGGFDTGVGWTLSTSGSGAASTISGGVLTMESPAEGGFARAKQTLSIAAPDQNVKHALRIVVERGPVILRVGTGDGLDNLISERELGTGWHSIAFTPISASAFVLLETRSAQEKIVNSIEIEEAGTLELPTSFETADLPNLDYDQSGDIVFIACSGQAPREVQRWATDSWSLVLHDNRDGPFQPANSSDITLLPDVLTGNGNLQASRDLFRDGHIGSIIRLFSSGQTVTAALAAQNTFTTAIRVTGVDAARIFSYLFTGTWSGTLTLQRSFDSATSGFADVSTFTANASANFDDGLDNSIAWYRVGFKTGQYTSGTATVTLTYASGGQSGVVRITSVVNSTNANIEVLSALSSLTATDNWSEADWSDLIGWPSAVTLFDGRLWWGGRDKVWGSVSDAFSSHDPDVEGDSGPINRSVGAGPVDMCNWLLPLLRLIVGREGSEVSLRASSQDEPLTPTGFTFKDCSTQGSTKVKAAKIDQRGIFVQKSNRRVYGLQIDASKGDYVAKDLTRLNLDIGLEGFVDMAAQRQPDTVVHIPRGDGEVACLLNDEQDEADAWWRATAAATASGDSIVEGVVVLPGEIEDRLYYTVKRVINGETKRFIERMARRDQCNGLPQARLSDCHKIVSSATAFTLITDLTHLIGEEVVLWGWNDDSTQGSDCGTGLNHATDTFSTLTVSAAGEVTSPVAFKNFCVGLPYRALFKSAKLAYGAQIGSAITQIKKLEKAGLCLINTHYKGLGIGRDFTKMFGLPLTRNGAAVAADTVHQEFDEPGENLPAFWETDTRLCLRAASPRPCTVSSVVVGVTTNEG
jgi:hypothetical protein